MKFGSVMRILGAVVLLSGCSFPGTVRYQVDQFTRESDVIAEMSAVGEEGLAQLRWRGRRSHRDLAALVFIVSSPTWRFLRCHNVEIRVDGQLLEERGSTHDGEPSRYGVVEAVSTQLSALEVERIANAHDVRYRICGAVYVMRPEQYATVGRFVGAWVRGQRLED
jgi:hypothetical protein